MLMNKPHPVHQDIAKIVGFVRSYFLGRLKQEPIQFLNQIIHDLRVSLQTIITDHFMQLSLAEQREFRGFLSDQLSSVFAECYGKHDHKDGWHPQYCIKEIMVCFEWAEQIKVEIPDDPITQKILAVDIPILRPFDYGFGPKKPISRPHKR